MKIKQPDAKAAIRHFHHWLLVSLAVVVKHNSAQRRLQSKQPASTQYRHNCLSHRLHRSIYLWSLGCLGLALLDVWVFTARSYTAVRNEWSVVFESPCTSASLATASRGGSRCSSAARSLASSINYVEHERQLYLTPPSIDHIVNDAAATSAFSLTPHLLP